MEQDLIIPSRKREVGSIIVERSIPAPQKRSVGPFVFLDKMGPMLVDDSHFLDVKPHPHIGLSTVTYLFQGKGLHKDSLGSHQIISPGDLNWMTAGKGIAHAEQTPEDEKEKGEKLHGVQIWVGLPKEFEEVEPSFIHYPKEDLPEIEISEDIAGKLMIGKFKGKISPVKTYSPMIFMEFFSKGEGQELLSFNDKEVALFLVEGDASVNNQKLEVGDLIIVRDPENVLLCFGEKTRLIIIGGEPFPEPRYIWWNFISSRKERILQAARSWENQLFPKVPGENEFTPLPNDPLPRI